MCRCISNYWCMYVYFDVLHIYTLFAGLFTKLMSIFVLIFMLLSLSAFVRLLLKKLLACLLTIGDVMSFQGCILHCAWNIHH